MDFSIIIQARMGSTRLPSKTMLKIKNKPLLDYVYNQVFQSKKISKIIIATTTLSEDNLISDYATSKNISVYRGDSQNVLDRFFQCAKKFSFTNIVRITADNPMIDPSIIDSCIEEFQKKDYDYVSNTISKTNDSWKYDLNGFPYGMAVEIFSFASLEKAWKNAKLNPLGEWYLSSGLGMGRSLIIAEEKNAFILSDRGTYLSFLHRKKINLKIIFGRNDKNLLNIYSVIQVNPIKHKKILYNEAKRFSDFLLSNTAQCIIENFKIKQIPLFYPARSCTNNQPQRK